jgi:multidrug efflux pump subunit AcrA (membrane-fusion protein)
MSATIPTGGLLLLLLLTGCHKGAAQEEAAEAKPLVTVKVATARAAAIDQAVRAPATIFPRERVNISSNLNTPIRALYARKGDKVTKNQLLALLEDRDLTAQ